jgi:uncharacterized membrane protein
MGWGSPMAGGWLLMTVLWVLLIAAAVALVIWILPSAPGRRSGGGTGPDPLQLLDERLARGEIDVAAYRILREELTRSIASR